MENLVSLLEEEEAAEARRRPKVINTIHNHAKPLCTSFGAAPLDGARIGSAAVDPATLAVYLVLYTHEIQLQFVLVSCLAWWHRGNGFTSFPEEQISNRYLHLCENCASV